uniref:Tic20 translocator protein n=1 Tax=Chrysotila carterae TaxID=13221 RepID=UPI0022F328AD|nr:Tic20 translocator protein [Chrysotila carterae]WAK83219.1 Tic20 translocator protein [Chrysotila carterae]
MFEDKISQRLVPLPAYIFPLVELIYYFGLKLCLCFHNPLVDTICLHYVTPIRGFYEQNILVIFGILVLIFTTCSKGTIPLPKFIRFNIIQAILINIVISCVGQLYLLCPYQIRENYLLINLVLNPGTIGAIIIIFYACILVLLGRYPKIPIISEAARLQTQRGYSDS